MQYVDVFKAQEPIHTPNPLVEQKKELITSLNRKVGDQQLSSTHENILTETLTSSTPDLNVVLSKLESLARVANVRDSKPPDQPPILKLLLPPTLSYRLSADLPSSRTTFWPTMKDQAGSRILIFAIEFKRNLETLAE